ncbi:glutamine--tRNA ligase [mine drainage metagenome]|jgi:glutaminyl-tRNA synthetase|uniref:glutamine--tRNA ligase n=1 Tax=mine drainage metagenome TaxID=410659 RepID=A0A1J5RAH1_9ZZZZ
MQAPDTATIKTSNFLRQIIESDLAAGRLDGRRYAGVPGDALALADAPPDAARIRTRFPPEPNGYLHIGHAKSICLNFGLARDYGGVCHLRLDDTNPEKEDDEYVRAIRDAVRWLGFDWVADGVSHEYFASDYFDFMHRAACALIEAGLAYVDEQSADEMRRRRGTLTEPGVDSPWRDRPAADSLERFAQMRDGRHAEGSMVLRAKVDMASPNINLRDPAIYRIKFAEHHRTGKRWCIYPMYTFAHPIEDALERITHSICTLEFEDQRPFYDWLLGHLADLGLLARPLPHQYEFARLNLTHVVTSKRKLAQLVADGHVAGWDDPRLPTLAGLRRRGYSAGALRLFAERIGVSKSDAWIDYATLEGALRDDLEPHAARAMAVLDPLKLVLVNWDEVIGGDRLDDCSAPVHPHQPERGRRHFQLGAELWIERGDYVEQPPKGFFRLFPGNRVRLKYGHVIECIGAERDAAGNIVEVRARLVPDTKSGTPGADAVKVKGVITWVGAADAVAAEIRLYDALFATEHPGAGGADFIAELNPDSLRVVHGWVEPDAARAAAGTHFQFERHGYFVADAVDHRDGRVVFNRTTTLRGAG